MASNVEDLILEATKNGSIAELSEIRSRNNWMAIPTDLIVKPCSQEGNTPLQVGVNSGHFNTVEFLIGELKYQIYPKWKTSMDSDCSFSWSRLNLNKPLPPFKKLSPEMEIIRNVTDQVPIAKLIEYLIDPVNDEPFQWLEFLLNSFVASCISQFDMIVALELMGSAFIFKQKRYVWRGLQCWQQAIVLRHSTASGNLAIPYVDCAQSDVSRKAFKDDFQAITSALSLERFQQDWRLRYSHVDVQAHALRISERILSQSGPNSFHLENLMRYGNCCRYEENEYSRALNVSLLILEQLNAFQSTSSPHCIRIFVRALHLMLNCLQHEPNSKANGELSFANFTVIVRFGLDILNKLMLLSPVTKTAIDDWQLNVMENVYHLLLDNYNMSHDRLQIQPLKDCLSNYFLTNNVHHSTNLLHLAIKKIDIVQRYPSKVIPVIQLFLETGADPTATDRNGKTALHILAENYGWFRFDLKSCETVFQALLDAGGRVDQMTPDGKTFMTILKEEKTKYQSNTNFIQSDVEPITIVVPLSCMCAQVIRQWKIPFEHRLPPRMQSFVGHHSALRVVSSLGESLLSGLQGSPSGHCGRRQLDN